jgi:hypothetical protein
MTTSNEELDAAITALPDHRACSILSAFARANQDRLPAVESGALEQPLTVSDDDRGDLARTALQLLARDPEFKDNLSVLVRGNSTERMMDPTTFLLTSGALLALQTRVRVEYKEGKWSFTIDKKAAGDSALKPLIARLVAAFG